MRCSVVPAACLTGYLFIGIVPLAAQEEQMPALTVALGSWDLSGPTASSHGVSRIAVAAQFRARRFVVGALWTREAGIEPGFAGLGVATPGRWRLGPFRLRLDLGLVAFRYSADEREARVLACNQSVGCFFEAENIAAGWTLYLQSCASAMVTIGPIALGPWVTSGPKVAGRGGTDRFFGPWGSGVQIEIGL